MRRHTLSLLVKSTRLQRLVREPMHSHTTVLTSLTFPWVLLFSLSSPSFLLSIIQNPFVMPSQPEKLTRLQRKLKSETWYDIP